MYSTVQYVSDAKQQHGIKYVLLISAPAVEAKENY
jgi:hypothetical protein